jgi:hypothetical protein
VGLDDDNAPTPRNGGSRLSIAAMRLCDRVLTLSVILAHSTCNTANCWSCRTRVCEAASRPLTRGVQGSGIAQYRGVGEAFGWLARRWRNASSRADGVQRSLAGSYPGNESGVLPPPPYSPRRTPLLQPGACDFSLEGPIRCPAILPANRRPQFTTAGETRCGCVDRGATRSLPSFVGTPTS